MMLAKSQSANPPLELSEVMQYALTPVPHSLGTPDGFFIFLGFAKAFDCVNLQILFNKFEHYGVRRHAYSLL